MLHVNLGYKGKTKYCARCLTRHAGVCEELQRFYEAKDLRKEQTITTMIVSDSTLRHADETGLSADVVCMSGGRLGNVGHIVIDEPTMSQVTQVIVVAGQNDILRDDETAEQFRVTITASLDLVQHTLFSQPTDVAFVQPLLPPDSSTLRKEKAQILHERCSTLTTIEAMPFKYIQAPTDLEMDGIHPTYEGTFDLLKHIDAQIAIITNEAYATDKKIYRGNQSVFKYGCLHCPRYLGLDNRYLCPACGDSVPQIPTGEQVTTPMDQEGLLSPGDSPGGLQIVDTHEADMERGGRKRTQSGGTPPVTPNKHRHVLGDVTPTNPNDADEDDDNRTQGI